MASEASDRVRTLLLRGDNLLKHGRSQDKAREALGEAMPGNGGGEPGKVVSEAFLQLQAAAGELDAVEVIVRDLERGLVDFPALRDGREVYLCWEEGEDEISHWHETDAGFSGRQDL
jgi:hypothetical protein